jgi:hypothetical protein
LGPRGVKYLNMGLATASRTIPCIFKCAVSIKKFVRMENTGCTLSTGKYGNWATEAEAFVPLNDVDNQSGAPRPHINN